MDLVVYSQYYRTRTPERQLEIDECLRRNLNHPGISRMVLFCESDAPPLPQGTGPLWSATAHRQATVASSCSCIGTRMLTRGSAAQGK
jgi:hypothetical protein